MSETTIVSDIVLTADGIKNFREKLKNDLTTVKESTADAATVEAITRLTDRLDSELDQVQMHPALASTSGWARGISPTIKAFNEILLAAIPPPATSHDALLAASSQNVTGACAYQGGCIVSTQAQCAALGGKFFPGAKCP
jgi:hypothetical protein